MPRTARRLRLWEPLVLGAVLVAAGVVLVAGDWLWRVDLALYDAALRFTARPLAADVVIVAIDEQSLQTLGRWPWSRRRHAALIKRLSAAGARAIALDLIFAEPDRDDPGADRALADAIGASGRVVLPVLLEQPRLGGYLVERLPIPPLAGAAAALGHVHVEIDRDGIARSVYLREGLGDARWSTLAMATRQVAGEAVARVVRDGEALAKPTLYRTWVRRDPVLIPFAGPPGSYPRISYAQVLAGEFLPGTFRDKLVLVGVTATGLGDALPTPYSGYGLPMPGVEINANLIAALDAGRLVEPASAFSRYLFTALLALLPALLYPSLSPRAGFVAATGCVALTAFASLGFLIWAHRWVPPATALATVTASYPLWSWRRLEFALRFLDRELRVLHREQLKLPVTLDTNTEAAVAFLRALLPVAGWAVWEGERVHSGGDQPPPDAPRAVSAGAWLRDGRNFWTVLPGSAAPRVLGLSCAGAGANESAALAEFLRRWPTPTAPPPPASGEVVRASVQRVQRATGELRAMRQVVDEGLAQMSDGVLVSDALGRVVLANRPAERQLGGEVADKLLGTSLFDALPDADQESREAWRKALVAALLERHAGLCELRIAGRGDLLVRALPLAQGAGDAGGVVVTVSDVTALKDSERRRAELLEFLSHDLRTPLVSALALIEIARERGTPAVDDELHRRMERHITKTLTLAEGFLELARVEGQEALRIEDMDLVAVAGNALDQVWSQANGRGVLLQGRPGGGELWMRGDPTLVERAIVNLLGNAIRCCVAGARVSVELEQAGDWARCHVIDQGPGIAPRDTDRIFNRFERIERPAGGRDWGAGLGLALVKAVAERHGGRVWVESELGRGSCFTLEFPLARPDGLRNYPQR